MSDHKADHEWGQYKLAIICGPAHCNVLFLLFSVCGVERAPDSLLNILGLNTVLSKYLQMAIDIG